MQEEFVRPWRRLRYLFSLQVRSSPLADVIEGSDGRAYAVPGLLHRWNSLMIDLRAALLFWPLMACVLLAALLFLCGVSPASTVAVGICTGITLAIFGAQPCSILISPLACGGGTVLLGLAFGFVQTMILTRVAIGALFSQTGIRGDFVVSIVGGLAGLSAPAWRATFPLFLIVLQVAAIAVSIAAAGWLMGQPQRAKRQVEYPGVRKEIGGAILGAAAGSGIGLIYLCNGLLGSVTAQPTTFVLAFAVIGGFWIGLSAFLRTRNLRRAIVATACHVVVACILFETAFWSAGTFAGLLALAAATGYFHSTWFTTAFVLGQWRGGVRAAVAATTLEGSVGFATFIVTRILQA